MIHVTAQAEPARFENDVRKPGLEYLKTKKRKAPTGKEWRSHAYWTKIIPDLYAAYGGICQFSCHWIPRDTGSINVEHFNPKSKFPKLAYEWTNYRLMCGTLNGRKKDYQDVLDPFTINDDMFIIDFPSLLVKPGGGLKAADKTKVNKTIARLRLNDAGTCLHAREHWIRSYCENNITFAYLKGKAPFLARELERQSLVDRIKTIMPYGPVTPPLPPPKNKPTSSPK